MKEKIKIYSEIAPLKKVLVHSPDGGIDYVPANKLHEWLYDDLLDVKACQREYAAFQALLLLFLNPGVMFPSGEFALEQTGRKKKKDGKKLLITNPEKKDYYLNTGNVSSACVIDTQFLIQDLMRQNQETTRDLIMSICAVEELHPYRKTDLLALLKFAEKDESLYVQIAKTFLTGKLEYEVKLSGELEKLNVARYIFPPIPNFIFTRDIGVTIGDHLLITKPKYKIRKREVLLFRFIAENFLCNNDLEKIISVSEDDDFFQIEEKNQPEYAVSYEGGDIMMISDRHVLIGYSERTSPYAIQKIVHRLFWENIKTNHKDGIDTVTVIKIGKKRAQMHIDTIFSHLREDLWVVHSPLSAIWQEQQKEKDRHTKNYNDDLLQKSASKREREKDLDIFQFFLNEEGRELKRQWYATKDRQERNLIKPQFKKLDFLLRTNDNGEYINREADCYYTHRPTSLTDLLAKVSVHEFGVESEEKVRFVHSGMGIPPFDGREQWTDACNLLTLRPGVSVGYDRNYKTALHYNEILADDAVTEDADFLAYVVAKNNERFRELKNSKGVEMQLEHILHVNDLFSYIAENTLDLDATKELISKIKNTMVLIPSKELSRARGGSHCMSLPVIRQH